MMSSWDNVYEVNVRRLALLTLPTIWRRPLTGALVYASVAPVTCLLGSLRTFRKDVRYRLTHNGQVCRLRGLLNDEFDPGLRGLRVADAPEGADWDGAMVWVREDVRGVRLRLRTPGGMRIGSRGFADTHGVDFVVMVPTRLRGVIDMTRLRGLVDAYRLAGKQWGVVFYGE